MVRSKLSCAHSRRRKPAQHHPILVLNLALEHRHICMVQCVECSASTLNTCVRLHISSRTMHSHAVATRCCNSQKSAWARRTTQYFPRVSMRWQRRRVADEWQHGARTWKHQRSTPEVLSSKSGTTQQARTKLVPKPGYDNVCGFGRGTEQQHTLPWHRLRPAVLAPQPSAHTTLCHSQ